MHGLHGKHSRVCYPKARGNSCGGGPESRPSSSCIYLDCTVSRERREKSKKSSVGLGANRWPLAQARRFERVLYTHYPSSFTFFLPILTKVFLV